MISNRFEDIVLTCKVIAKCVGTLVEIREYKDLKRPWASICFMTDHFGGVHTILHYDYGYGRLTLNYGTDKPVEIYGVKQLFDIVKKDYDELVKKRDLTEIYERVNAEYD